MYPVQIIIPIWQCDCYFHLDPAFLCPTYISSVVNLQSNDWSLHLNLCLFPGLHFLRIPCQSLPLQPLGIVQCWPKKWPGHHWSYAMTMSKCCNFLSLEGVSIANSCNIFILFPTTIMMPPQLVKTWLEKVLAAFCNDPQLVLWAVVKIE